MLRYLPMLSLRPSSVLAALLLFVIVTDSTCLAEPAIPPAAYRQTIPGTAIEFTMVPVPGGIIEMGPADGAPTDPETTSPKQKVKVESFWIGRCEVSWDEYWKFMELNSQFTQLQKLRTTTAQDATKKSLLQKFGELWKAVSWKPTHIDGITAPTALYDSSTAYESGEEPNLPAVSMTPYAARQYTKWLSAITQQQYRLPTEAEWELAASADAGGDDRFWHVDNSDYAAQPIDSKAANRLGIHNLRGNVAEWVLDAPELENSTAGDPSKVISAEDAIRWPKTASPRIAKGGHWDADPSECQRWSRLLSNDEDWKMTDPNLPKSPWWFTDYPAGAVGFRLVRPMSTMDQAMLSKVWEMDAEQIVTDVNDRLEEGRGKLGPAIPELPKAIQQLEEPIVCDLID